VTRAGAASGGALRVVGGVGGVAARLDELDDLARALFAATSDCGSVVALAVRGGTSPGLLGPALVDPTLTARLLAATAEAVGWLCRAGSALAGLGAGVAAATASYRTCERTAEALAYGVPLLVGVRLRVAAVTSPLPWLAGGLVVGSVGTATAVVPGARERLVAQVVSRPDLVDVAVRVVPGVLGVPDVRSAARATSLVGRHSGLLAETRVSLAPARRGRDAGATSCARPAGGVADLLRRGQSVAAWREPGPGEHDTLPPGSTRPQRGQVRVDEVVGPDGAVAWVVHVPGTQEWDGDGEGSPMDMTANVALVAGADTAVAGGVADALVRAGARPGQPVALVGHSQGGMTAMAVAADPRVRKIAMVTHVVTAGSPVAGRTPPPGVQVLALEHPEDLVPRLDGRDHPDHRDMVTVRAAAPDGPWRTDAVPAHSSSAYVATAERVDASTHPSLVGYRAGLAPFLDRKGAVCRSHHVVLRRTGTP
jgi:alpha-beta hydrolase superfamily lysophospholipase